MSGRHRAVGVGFSRGKLFRRFVIVVLVSVSVLGILNSSDMFSAVVSFGFFWFFGFVAFRVVKSVYYGSSASEVRGVNQVATLDVLSNAFPPPEGEPFEGMSLSPEEMKVWDSMVSRLRSDEDGFFRE